ncbi:glycosyltransferase family 2 protein [Candidatus Roizmanbacteria bacterium]|nr:glycosyltransferase family 2 protein [Candidatus Roizmanbacteria bacterium]
MNKLKGLSLFFPALNDAQILPELIKKADNVAKKCAYQYEIIVINDGSSDNTEDVLTELGNKYPHLSAIHHRKNKGYGSALIEGFNRAKNDWVFYTDGDGQYDPSELIKLVEEIDERTDIINGFKLTREDDVLRRSAGWLYNRLLQLIYHPPVSDVDCDFRLIKKSVLNKFVLTSHSGLICLELVLKLKKAGAKFKEVGVSHYKRRYGKSQFFNPRHLLSTLREHVAFYLNQFSTTS